MSMKAFLSHFNSLIISLCRIKLKLLISAPKSHMWLKLLSSTQFHDSMFRVCHAAVTLTHFQVSHKISSLLFHILHGANPFSLFKSQLKSHTLGVFFIPFIYVKISLSSYLQNKIKIQKIALK